jgi:EAL domain-containing protein (putative c-di-GMP-specific phosphodiesterase class I)
LEKREVRGGQVIFSEGQPPDTAYLIEEGRVAISAGGAPLRELEPGCMFGELAVLDGAPRGTTAVAIGPTRLSCISRVQLQRRVASADPVLRALVDVLLLGCRTASSGHRPLDHDVLHRMRLEAELSRAISEDELKLHYQPIVDLQTREIRGAEALVRWAHPEQGLIDPEQFVLLAEETPLILSLDRWAITRACRDLATIKGMEGRSISINLSGREVGRDDIIDFVAAACDRHGLSRSQLKLEVTESAVVQSTRAAEWLDRCSAHGFTTVLDDFGTGYSNLAYLLHLPMDTLKLDRTFTANIEAGGRSAAVVEAVVAMARALDMTIVAEGIETEPAAAALAALGCQFGQGYLFARPMTPGAFAKALTAY